MNLLNSSRIFAGVMGAMLLANHAFAGTCRTLDRTFPGSGGNDEITIQCQRNGQANASASLAVQNSNGQKFTVANLLAGAGQTATTFGLDINGSTLAFCTATDITPGNGPSNPVQCPGGAKWRAQVTHAG